MKTEIWKDIEWYGWLYQISNFGNVKSIRYNRTRILKYSKPHWYAQVKLPKQSFKIHRLVAQAFIPNPDNKPYVNHKNWIRNDNRVENLEWCTASENLYHSIHTLWNKTNFHINPPSKWKFWFNNKSSIAITQYSKEWIFIKHWWGACDASRNLLIWQPLITRCCKWNLKSAGWFIWKYK